MAASTRTHEGVTNTAQPSDNGLRLVWLDDTAEEDPGVKEIFTSLFDNVFIFTDHVACLELVESIDIKVPCLSILISGKYGQMLVRDRIQPLNQVKDIYVFCYDTVKHGRWAQTCNKVRCVFSDINKIIQSMQYDIQNSIEQRQLDDEPQPHPDESIRQQRERYTDDNNLFDYLALNLLLQSPDDGAEDFITYCQAHNENKKSDHHDANEEDRVEEVQEQCFKPEQTLQEWYKPDLFFTNINSNDLTKLWTLRWFIRQFHRQLTNEQEKFIKDKTKFTINHSTWLSLNELDGMKHRIGEIIITTEFLLTYTNRQTALDSIQNNEINKHKVLFEINVDTTTRGTVPYTEIKKRRSSLMVWCSISFD